MKIAIMQPYIFPYIGYYQLMESVDKFIIYDDINYINKGWIDRNRVLIHGKPQLFKLPLSKKSQNKTIAEHELAVSYIGWAYKLLKTLRQNYAKSPNYSIAMPLITDILTFKTTSLSQLLRYSLEQIAALLEIKCLVTTSSTAVYGNNDKSGEARIIDICQQEGANQYINLSGGKHLYDKNNFRKKGIQLSFLDSQQRPYQQNAAEFVPSLSMIDVLMNNPVSEIKRLVRGFELS
ncbi:WbqC family protein [Neiella marina]|uniref:WbqC family protein n=1 Tax=Neiella holothuriorum TaxID=2870530 RepID=A0ABS7EEP9_9GAMM|nr:WbqC family protein [Neiella holothuriorum]MBW8190817.1 WbqC family protein [Neiella holothuriorum]